MKELISLATKSRSFIIAWTASLLVLLIFLGMSALEIKPSLSGIQVPIRYSSFGITNFYTGQWHDEFLFVGVALMSFVFHSLISLRLLRVKNEKTGIYFQWLSLMILLIIFFIVRAIFSTISMVGKG